MKRCPITYQIISAQEDYSQRGLRLLAPQLKQLSPLEWDAAQQRDMAKSYIGKMSIQGVQLKLSAQLKIKAGRFEIVMQKGHYILKPQNENFFELPENEAITMSLAELIGIEVPMHGLVYSKDKSMTYFIKRFDRIGHMKKLAVEDFSQLLREGRDTKYNSSMEKVAGVVIQFCTFPVVELEKLFRLTLFNFLVGNEDMHLKNFSLITRGDIITLSPVYDLLNSTIAQTHVIEELALPLNGKKNNLTKNDFLKYFGVERMGLNQNVINKVLKEIQQAFPRWEQLIKDSFLSQSMQSQYLQLLQARRERLGI
jgi:serine/threonine-protein kinase HipA